MKDSYKDFILTNGIVITPFNVIKNAVLFLKNGKIEKIINLMEFKNYNKKYLDNYKIIDVNGNYISPGFIDIHTHRGNQIDLISGSYERLAGFNAKYGTTGFLPTLWNADLNVLLSTFKKINTYMEKQDKGARVLGINSEGPYINPNVGARRKKRAIIPKYEDYYMLLKAAGSNLKLMTVSPEVQGCRELVRFLRMNNVAAAIGYSNISVKGLYEAIDLGVDHINHIFNPSNDAISEERGTKASGIDEELLICDSLTSEVIADRNGIHVNPTWLKILLRCKGVENLILITDSRDIAGSRPGKYVLDDGSKAVLKEGDDIVRLEDGFIAGCNMTMNEAVGNVIKHTGASLADSVRMATFNPAKAIKVSNKKGAIKEGMDADITVFDDDMDIKLTFVEGDLEYKKIQ